MCKIKLSPYAISENIAKINMLQTHGVFIEKIDDNCLEITNIISGDHKTDMLSLQQMCNTVCKIYEITNQPDFEVTEMKFLLKCDNRDKYISGKLVEKYITDIFYSAAQKD
jgi:hypothetical protein